MTAARSLSGFSSWHFSELVGVFNHICVVNHAGPPSSYDEEGVLTTELSSLSDLRLIKASSLPAAPQAASATDLHTSSATAATTEPTITPVAKAAIGDSADVPGTAAVPKTAGVSGPALISGTAGVPGIAANDSRGAQGNQSPAQQSSSNEVPSLGAWAELSHQLAHRKAELADKARGSSGAAGGLQGGGGKTEGSERKVGGVTGMQTPGAARPRGGVRASAMGPMLAFLRSSGGLDSNTSS